VFVLLTGVVQSGENPSGPAKNERGQREETIHQSVQRRRRSEIVAGRRGYAL